jgi:hypothetical protein
MSQDIQAEIAALEEKTRAALSRSRPAPADTTLHTFSAQRSFGPGGSVALEGMPLEALDPLEEHTMTRIEGITALRETSLQLEMTALQLATETTRLVEMTEALEMIKEGAQTRITAIAHIRDRHFQRHTGARELACDMEDLDTYLMGMIADQNLPPRLPEQTEPSPELSVQVPKHRKPFPVSRV